jgi:hypothetical protein
MKPQMLQVPTNSAEAGRMFGDPDTRVSLSTILKRIMVNNEVTNLVLDERIDAWRDHTYADLSEEGKANIAVTTRRLFTYPNISWDDFLKALDIIGVDRVAISI